MGTLPDWIAAIAAIAAAGLVAWQSWETRKSAQASAAASTTANSAVELSRSALEIARTEERHTRRLIIEGVKARIDANSYPLKILVDRSAVWPPHEPSISGGAPNPLPTDIVYRLPRDANKPIMVLARFDILNQGSEMVVVGINEPWYGDDGNGGRQLASAGSREIYSGKRLSGEFHVTRTVSEWAEVAEYRFDRPTRRAGDTTDHLV